MAVRQYIGARYTIKIYENSLDPSSAAWESGFAYEYLTLVTVNNDAYLSKKDVPSSIGSPTTNPAYWVKVGDFNGQIANLQNQIDIINGTLTTLNGRMDTNESIVNFIDKFAGKNVVIYGDSLSVANTTWVKPLGDLITSIGGTVTLHTTSNWKTAEALAAANSDNNVYDFALIWIGINDANTGVSLGKIGASNTFIDNYYELLKRIRTVSSNCEIYCFGLAYAKPATLGQDISKTLYYYDTAIESVARFSGATFKTLLGLPRNNYADNSATTDGTHFTETYSKTTFVWTIINYLLSSATVPSPELSFKLIKESLFNNLLSGSCDIITYDECYADKYGIHLTFMLNVTATIPASTNIISIIPEALRPEQGTICATTGGYFYLSHSGNLVSNIALTAGNYPVTLHYRPVYMVSSGLS